jgi:hypothetical protein
MYIPWDELKEERTVIYGMGLLPNNDGMLLATKLALLPTAVERGDQASLGSIDVSKLISDLEQCQKTEPQGKMFPLSDPDVDLAMVAGSVIDFCNNEPSGQNGWDITSGFKSKATGDPLTRSQIEHELNSLFGSIGSPKYVTEDEQVFEIWKSLRFGPLALND